MYARHKNSFKSLHWSSKETQIKRFEILCQIADLRGRKVLDLGCGFGDLLGFLKSKNIFVKYSGIDIVEEFILKAKATYKDGDFLLGNIDNLNIRVDYVLASGLFAFGNKTFFFHTITKALSLARFGLGFNIYKPEKDDRFFYISKQDVLFFAQSLDIKEIVVKDGYTTNDTSYFLYKK